MGNAVVTPTATYHFQDEELHDTNIYVDANTSGFNSDDITLLTSLALSVQTTVRSVSRNYAQNVISQIMASDDWNLPAKPGDLSVSILRRARVYEMDFGPCLGTPCDFDVPDNRTDGLGWIMPPRSESSARLMGYQSRGFWEVRMALDPVEMESLRNDMLWREITLGEPRCCKFD
ncbi:transferase family-domain-containing protein [Penicillium brevicompactum]